MKIIVLIKQVPEMEKVKFDTEKGVINRKSAGVEINPFDLNALETAVQIKEEIGGEIIGLSMGPERASESLKEAIARGADEGYLLTDSNFGGSDTIATSNVLASGIKKIGDFDLIIAGEMTVDGDTAQVGPQVAEFLNIPHISYVTNLRKIEKTNLEVTCNIWRGNYKKKIRYPGLITVTKDINTPRLPSFKDKAKARKATINKLTLEDIKEELIVDKVGIKGSPTRVKNIVIPDPVSRKGEILRGEEKEEAIKKIYNICIEKNVIKGGK